MSLDKKLGSISQNLELEKKNKEKKEEEERLKPIREKVEFLSRHKQVLEIIKNSLELKSDKNKGQGLGMEEYSEQTTKKVKSETAQLDQVMTRHQEALKSVGVGSREGLISHPDFAEEEEVIAYKKAVEQDEGLKMSDADLQTRLKKVGVDFNLENFSYSEANRAVTEKLQAVDQELRQEKLKTPEGREEVLEEVAKKLETATPRIEFSLFDRGRDSGITIDNDYNPNIRLSGEKAKFSDWHRPNLIPGDFDKLITQYGEELTREGLRKAYRSKVEKAVSAFDIKNENAVSLRQQLEVNRAEVVKARQMLQEFIHRKEECQRLLTGKAEELKKKNIKFSPEHASGYGNDYNNLLELSSGRTADDLQRELWDDEKFPPEYDFKKIQERVQSRLDSLKEFAAAVNDIQSQEDADNLSRGQKSPTSSLHTNQLNLRWPETKFKFKTADGYDSKFLNDFIHEHKTYSAAGKFLGDRVGALTRATEKISETLDLGLQTQLKEREFDKAAREAGLGSSQPSSFESQVNRIEKDGKDAQKLLEEIKTLQLTLPQTEELSLANSYIHVPSIEAELKTLAQETSQAEQNLQDLERKVERHQAKEPKLFGKDKWQAELDSLDSQKTELKEKIRKMKSEDYNTLYRKSVIYIPTERYSHAEGILKEYKARGKAAEIFIGLEKDLAELIDRKVPPVLTKLYEEFRALENQLK